MAQIPVHRASFEEALSGVPAGSAKAEAFLSNVEHELVTYRHPDPYTFPVSANSALCDGATHCSAQYYEGGTKFQRNSPPPEFVLHGKMEEIH